MNKLLTLRREWVLLAIIVGIALAVGARAPVFLSWRNGMDIANDSAILAILVMGQMLVLLTRGVDLSVASNLALTGMVCALAGRSFPELGVVSLVALAIAVGTLLGAINGWLITRFSLPPIVVTLGTPVGLPRRHLRREPWRVDLGPEHPPGHQGPATRTVAGPACLGVDRHRGGARDGGVPSLAARRARDLCAGRQPARGGVSRAFRCSAA
jgi:hypothetical protein